jgi:2-polyprenyl-6-methoxyphenol hydroxylase-like FAD-dependent oxidoreductase
MAIESSVVLARCLAQEHSLPEALHRYETERMPRTAWITDQSWKIGRVGQWENPVACMLRNGLVRFTPRRFMEKMLEKAVAYEV